MITSVKVPRPIINKLHAAMVEALKSPDIVLRMGTDGSIPVGSSPEQFGTHIKSGITNWRKLFKDLGLTLH